MSLVVSASAVAVEAQVIVYADLAPEPVSLDWVHHTFIADDVLMYITM